MAFFNLSFHVLFDFMHRNVSGAFNKCLNILIPGTEHQFSHGIEFGKLADGKITFPDNKMYYLQIAFANYLEGVPMNGNTHNKFLVTIPAQDGVDEITVDEQGTPEYYNMQGMRVDNPTPGCLYIRRTGSKVEKIIAR